MRFPVVLALRFLAAALGVALSFGSLSGCAASSSRAEDGSAAVTRCRTALHQLSDLYDARGEATLPSDLAARWQALAAAASFRESTATAECSVPLGAMRATADQIDALSGQLRPHDLRWALADRSRIVLEALAARTPGSAKTRRQLRLAFAALERNAPASAADMDAGWKTANSIDLDEPTQVAKLLSDMDFLARDSETYGAGRAALTRVDRLVSLSRRSR